MLEQEVADLKEQLNLNSDNSSKPPSSDLPGKKEKGRKIGSGKKRGAQPGHKGSIRKLVKCAVFDEWTDYLWTAGQAAMLVRKTRSGGGVTMWTIITDVDS